MADINDKPNVKDNLETVWKELPVFEQNYTKLKDSLSESNLPDAEASANKALYSFDRLSNAFISVVEHQQAGLASLGFLKGLTAAGIGTAIGVAVMTGGVGTLPLAAGAVGLLSGYGALTIAAVNKRRIEPMISAVSAALDNHMPDDSPSADTAVDKLKNLSIMLAEASVELGNLRTDQAKAKLGGSDAVEKTKQSVETKHSYEAKVALKQNTGPSISDLVGHYREDKRAPGQGPKPG